MEKIRVDKKLATTRGGIVSIIVFFLICHQSMAQTTFVLDLKTNAAFKGPYNEIHVPGNGGTPFDILVRHLLPILPGFSHQSWCYPE